MELYQMDIGMIDELYYEMFTKAQNEQARRAKEGEVLEDEMRNMH